MNKFEFKTQGGAALSSQAPHPRITRDKRKIAQLAIFPNFLRFTPKTSFNPDVVQNRFACKIPLRDLSK